jgi:hypothetical protein
MPKVGVNNDPLLERLVFGFDGVDYRVVKVDGDGNLMVALDFDQDIRAYSYGRVNAAWHKDPIRFGYSDTVGETVQNLDLPAGTSVLDGTAVAYGYVHVITQASILYLGTSPANIDIRVKVGGVSIIVFRQKSPVSNQMYDRQGYWVLEEGDYVQAVVDGATLNDNFYLWYSGFKIDIAL